MWWPSALTVWRTTHQLAAKEFSRGPWLDPSNNTYGKDRRHTALQAEVAALTHGHSNLKNTEATMVTLAETN